MSPADIAPLYDAHNHLQDAWLAPHRQQVLADLARIPLRCAVVNGTEENDWSEVAALARAHPLVRPSFGLHPWHVGNASSQWRDTLRRALDAEPRAAIGEIGLDRWILERARPDDPRLDGLRRASLEEQLEAFTWQLALAAERKLPVTIHCIDAWGPLLDALRASPKLRGGFLLHAYGGSVELARVFAALGGFFSFNGYFLWPRQAARCEVFKTLPADRLLVETDAPAMPLPPEQRVYSLPGDADGHALNHPANIAVVYDALAKLRATTPEALHAQVEANFERLFAPRRGRGGNLS